MKDKKIKSAVTKGAVKVPVIMQLEALECGAASLAMVMAYYDKWVPLEQVRADCGVSRDGSNAKNIYMAAESYGFDVKAYRRSPESIKENGQYPCIIHWNFNHFVVLNGFKGKYAYIYDPARGFVKVGAEEFDKSFTGVTIVPIPGKDFEPSGKRKSTIDFARKRLIGAGTAVAFVMLTTVISSIFGIINPIMSRIFMDRLLTGQNSEWLMPFIGVMCGLAAVQLIVAWAQTIYSLKINGKMSVIGSTAYMWKVLHMPMEFFSQRMAGDIQSRQATNASIAGTLVNTFAPLLLNTAMMAFYLILMLKQSLVLSTVGISTLVLNIFITRMISEKRVNITRVMQRDSAKLDSTTVAGIADDIRAMPMGMQTLISEGQGGISGGQKQRIMIARAVAPKPKILMFDEATSSLDNKTQRQVGEALDKMGCTRIVIAHRLSTIRHCDRILVLDGGRIIEEGSYEQLIRKNGYFAELVKRQRLDLGQ